MSRAALLNREPLQAARAAELRERVLDLLALADGDGRRDLTPEEAQRAGEWLDEADALDAAA